MTSTTVLWIYIGLLVVGGVIGFIKAGSRVSLITSLAFAGLLTFSALKQVGGTLDYPVLGLLTVVFAMRLAKTKKFMPSGMLMVVTLATLAAYAVLSQG